MTVTRPKGGEMDVGGQTGVQPISRWRLVAGLLAAIYVARRIRRPGALIPASRLGRRSSEQPPGADAVTTSGSRRGTSARLASPGVRDKSYTVLHYGALAEQAANERRLDDIETRLLAVERSDLRVTRSAVATGGGRQRG
jgi:hypothetical protein